MKHLLSAALLVSACSALVSAQPTPSIAAPCKDETIRAISSRGIKLGLGLEETLQAFAESGTLSTLLGGFDVTEGKDKTVINEYPAAQSLVNLRHDASGRFGLSTIDLAPKDLKRFDGISRYNLYFVDEQLAAFTVFYTKPKWESLRQFAEVTSGLLNIPVDDKLRTGQRVQCGRHWIMFRQDPNGPYSMGISSNIDEVLRLRSKRAADAQRELDMKAFKP
jgi:hypothetical protein